MDKEQKELELKKLGVERAKVLEGILRTLFFVLVADIGGTLTLLLNFHKYNPAIAITLIGLGIFSSLGFVFSIGIIAFEIKEIKDKTEL